jgi:hypothetical protein
MKCVCDLNLHIWNLSFGYPGVLNDINILNISPLFSKFLAGVFPPVKPRYMICDSEIDWFTISQMEHVCADILKPY